MPKSPQQARDAARGKIDFFISYTGADVAWAEWIALELESAGYKTVFQLWDFAPGSNFALAMKKAAAAAARTLAVLSPRYLRSDFAQAEWAAAFAADPSGEQRKLVPIRIEKFPVTGLDAAIVYIDLVDLDEDAARKALLHGLEAEREKRKGECLFPGKGKRSSRSYAGWLPPAFGLPARNRNFSGREALLDLLRKQLAAGSATALTVATCEVATHGLGGTGKSQLAIEYAWRWISDYTRIIWLRAETPASLGADFDTLADELSLFNDNKPPEQTAVIATVRKHLEENPGWLLIFDNVPEPRAVEYAVPRAGGHVIFTSRYTAWGQYAASLRVDVWLPKEAEEFFRLRFGAKSLAQDDPERCAGSQIAKELGYLPLALEHAAAYCEQSSLALADYLPLFRAKRLELFRPEALGGDQEMVTVTTTYNLSLDRIHDDEKCPEAAGLFNLCAFFDPDRISLTLLRGGVDYLQKPLSSLLQSDLKVNQALSTLLRYSLIAVQGGGNERVLSVHRLVQEVTRERLKTDEKDRWITAALQIVNQAFPLNSYDVREWPICGQLTPHAAVVLQRGDLLRSKPAVRARLLNKLGVYAWARAEYDVAEPRFQCALGICREALAPGHPDIIVQSLSNLASFYCSQGRYEEAEPQYRLAVHICENCFGPDDVDTARCINNLALLCSKRGCNEQAEPLYQRALAIYEKALGPDHPDTGHSLNNLASLYCAQGRNEQAEPLYQRALAIYEKALGPDHPDTGGSLSNLASLYCAQGRNEQAEPLYQRALAICEKTLGPDHPDTAQTLNNLAVLYRDQRRYEQAEPLYQRALAICEKTLGPDHPVKATVRVGYAWLLRATGRDAEAAALEGPAGQQEQRGS
jgi:tetratricopeptide (TPR) repeat protein